MARLPRYEGMTEKIIGVIFLTGDRVRVHVVDEVDFYGRGLARPADDPTLHKG